METRTLRYFLAVAREENMTRAAEYLHVTQPTLSKQIQSLEDELGKKLFIRHSFRIELTEAGILLRKRAEDLVSMADKIMGEFTALDDLTGGDVYLGLAESYQINVPAGRLFGSGRILSDSVSRTGDQTIQRNIPRPALSYQQRGHGAGHGKAG